MTTLPMLAGLLAVLAAAAVLSVGPLRVSSVRASLARRPVRSAARATQYDVERLLSRSLSSLEVGLVHRWAADRAVPAPLLWQWVTRHGPEALLLCLAAGFTSRDLADHLGNLAALDRRSLELQAELRALEPAHDHTHPAESLGGPDDLGGSAWD